MPDDVNTNINTADDELMMQLDINEKNTIFWSIFLPVLGLRIIILVKHFKTKEVFRLKRSQK